MNLYAHQKKIIDENPAKAGLFMGTGSGKTRIALMLAKDTTLVIAPKTQVEDRNWEREYRKIVIETVKKYHKREQVKTFRDNLTVMSKEAFRRDAIALPRFNTVIVDEAHTCLGVTASIRWRHKQPIPKSSQIFEALEAYIARTKPDRFYLCTATIIRSPMTVWAAAKLLGEKWSWYEFRNTYYVRLPMPGREVFTPKSDSATKNRLAKAVRKIGYTGQLSDYFDVPDQSHKTIFLELTAKQNARIKALPLEYPDPLVLLGKTHSVENGVLNGDEFNASEAFENAKIDALKDLALEFPRMLVFAKYRAQIAQIASAMEDMGKKVLILTGDTKDRGKLISEANSSPEYVFIAQAQISAGYELPECPVMVFASMSYSVVDRIQGEGRILRANALKKNLYIDLVVRGGVDEAVYDSIRNKKDFNERIYLNL